MGFDESTTRPTPPGVFPASPALDERQVRLLAALAANCRRDSGELAESLGLPPALVREDIARLEAAGLIVRYRADIDWWRFWRMP